MIVRNDAKNAMYSDYFDDPNGISEAMKDDGNDSEENMDDIESDEASDNSEEMATERLNNNEDDHANDDDGPKSTLEKQQEKVGQRRLFIVGEGGLSRIIKSNNDPYLAHKGNFHHPGKGLRVEEKCPKNVLNFYRTG